MLKIYYITIFILINNNINLKKLSIFYFIILTKTKVKKFFLGKIYKFFYYL